MKNGKTVVAFDVDDTLLVPNIAMYQTVRDYKRERGEEPIGYPQVQSIHSYQWFQEQGYYMIIWSGSGVEWAKRWAKKFDLQPDEIIVKEKHDWIDISVDDCVVDLAKVNLKVKRINNSISRAEWNKTKH